MKRDAEAGLEEKESDPSESSDNQQLHREVPTELPEPPAGSLPSLIMIMVTFFFTFGRNVPALCAGEEGRSSGKRSFLRRGLEIGARSHFFSRFFLAELDHDHDMFLLHIR